MSSTYIVYKCETLYFLHLDLKNGTWKDADNYTIDKKSDVLSVGCIISMKYERQLSKNGSCFPACLANLQFYFLKSVRNIIKL